MDWCSYVCAVYFIFGEPLILFILDYMAVMGLFVFLGHYLAKWINTSRS